MTYFTVLCKLLQKYYSRNHVMSSLQLFSIKTLVVQTAKVKLIISDMISDNSLHINQNTFYLIQDCYSLIIYLMSFYSKQDICKTTIFYADQMCKRVVAAQGNASFKNVSLGLVNSINDGEYVRGRRRGKLQY